MSLLSENVIPGNHGKIFETNATEHLHLEKIRKVISEVTGVKNVTINTESFPREITVYTSSLVSVERIESVVVDSGFHAIPKSMFEL